MVYGSFNLTRVPLLCMTLLHIVGQCITNSADLRALKDYHICAFFGFSCKALFSDTFSIYMFLITIDLYFKPGLYIRILTYPIAVLRKHPVFKGFLTPFPPSSGLSISPPPTPASWFYIFILGSSFFLLFCFVLECI